MKMKIIHDFFIQLYLWLGIIIIFRRGISLGASSMVNPLGLDTKKGTSALSISKAAYPSLLLVEHRMIL